MHRLLGSLLPALGAFVPGTECCAQARPTAGHIAAALYKVDSADGLKYAQEAVRLEPELSLAHYLLGLLLLDTGAYERAAPELETTRKAFQQEAKIDLSLATAYAHTGRPNDAARVRADFACKKQAKHASDAVEITDTMDAGSKL